MLLVVRQEGHPIILEVLFLLYLAHRGVKMEEKGSLTSGQSKLTKGHIAAAHGW